MSATAKAKTPRALTDVRALAEALQACELETAKARARLTAAIILAGKAHLPREVAEAAGVSRQRVVQVIAKANGRG